MTRWSYEEVREIYKDRDRYRDLVRKIAKRGCDFSCTGSCLVCEAKALVAEDARRYGDGESEQ